MKNLKQLFAAAAAVLTLGTAAPAFADTITTSDGSNETTVVAKRESSSFGIVAKDSLYGGLTGALIGGGVLLIQNDFDNAGRTMAIATGAGILVGAAVGIVDVATTRAVDTANAQYLPHSARPDVAGRASLASESSSAPLFAVGHSGRF